jgi:hypothetical protein
MILAKGMERFYNDFCFTDSIVTNICWDNHLLDLLITVDYYWDIQEGKDTSRELTIRFQNCREANFSMTKAFGDIPKNEIKSYVLSWYTITHCTVKNDNGLAVASLKTTDDNPWWLTVKCEEIWVESEE